MPKSNDITNERKRSSRNKQPDAASSLRWQAILNNGIRFVATNGKVAEPVWKRRKAGELFVYLLLQPGYKANREQVIERVFGEGEPSKRSNQLYVTLHDLRHALKELGMSEDLIYAKRGVIGIDENSFDSIDAETFLTLSRVGDQLWMDDRDAACRLYEEAIPLYGQLGTELPYADWLERIREQLLDRQTTMLKRLATYHMEHHDDERAEQRLTEWISLRPEQENAYETMIRHCLNVGRRAEAIGWYRRLEKMCREELGNEPLEEIRKLYMEISKISVTANRSRSMMNHLLVIFSLSFFMGAFILQIEQLFIFNLSFRDLLLGFGLTITIAVSVFMVALLMAISYLRLRPVLQILSNETFAGDKTIALKRLFRLPYELMLGILLFGFLISAGLHAADVMTIDQEGWPRLTVQLAGELSDALVIAILIFTSVRRLFRSIVLEMKPSADSFSRGASIAQPILTTYAGTFLGVILKLLELTMLATDRHQSINPFKFVCIAGFHFLIGLFIFGYVTLQFRKELRGLINHIREIVRVVSS